MWRIIGFIGAMLVVGGILLPWSTMAGGATGLQILLARTIATPPVAIIAAGCIVTLIGGLLTGVFGIVMMDIEFLIPLGGIITTIGWAVAATRITDWSLVSVSFYLCIIGAALAIVCGIIGFEMPTPPSKGKVK